MKFLEAKAKLKKLADGKYHQIKYSLTEYSSKILKAECECYIGGFDWVISPTWEESLRKMEIEINGPPIPNAKEAPEEEVTA